MEASRIFQYPIDDGSALTRRNSLLSGPLGLSAVFSPTEIIARLEAEFEELREKVTEALNKRSKTPVPRPLSFDENLSSMVDDLKEIQAKRFAFNKALIANLGGNVYDQMERSYRGYDYNGWYNRVFGRQDGILLRLLGEEISDESGIPIDELNVLDSGTGKYIRMIRQAIGVGFNPDRMWGYDIFDYVVDEAKYSARALGIPEDRIIRADMRNVPGEYQQGDKHLIISGCHTMNHNDTEVGAVATLEGFAAALVPGGKVFFDSTAVFPDAAKEDPLGDLKNLYTLFWMHTCEKMQPIIDQAFEGKMPGGALPPFLTQLSRYSIEDRTANPEVSVLREVFTAEYVDQLIRAYKLPFSTDIKEYRYVPKFRDEAEKRQLGEQWLDENQLNVFLARKIRDKKRIFGLQQSFNEIREHIVGALAPNYPNVGYVLKRTEDSEVKTPRERPPFKLIKGGNEDQMKTDTVYETEYKMTGS